MKIRGSHLVALAITAGIGGWMYTGKLILGGQVDPTKPTIAEREAKRKTAAFRVRVVAIQPSERLKILEVRGRTRANASIGVRAETGGTIATRPVEKGAVVKPGDLLCTLDQGIRHTSVEQAKTQLAQAQADYNSNKKLVKRGFATKSKLRGLRTALNAAKSALASVEQDMGRTEIRATTAGIIQAPMAEVGDNLAKGGLCVTILDTNPMVFTGQVSERDISRISPGMEASIKLISGENVSGKIRFISSIADAKTRTFEIEIELPNNDGTLRDGLTAEAHIPLAPITAYKVNSSWLLLADDGAVGIRAVDNANKVAFHPVKILGHAQGKLWVQGLAPGLNIITLGQNFVTSGETVTPVTAAQLKLLEATASSTFEGKLSAEMTK